MYASATVLTREQLKHVMGGDFETTNYMEDDGSSTKKDACKGQSQDTKCSYSWNNTTQYGCCTSYMASEIFCSTLLTSCF